MSAEVVMPQMGESIAEGTITRWLKKVGDKIERDENIFEISTDKVDAEVPATAAGTLTEIRHHEGETVAVGAVVAIISDSDNANDEASTNEAKALAETQPGVDESDEVTDAPEPPPAPQPQPDGAPVTPANADIVPDAVPTETDETAVTGGEPVVMPQMGESIAEGTITRWLKKVGDKVERDENIFEISTDKVDAEVPATAAGILTQIIHGEGETVAVGSVVGIIGGSVGAGAPVSTPAASRSAPAQTATADAMSAETPDAAPVQAVAQTRTAAPSTPAPPIVVADKPRSEQSLEELRRTRSSPLVRNIAKEHGIAISQLEGSGASGRVTKKDILEYIASGAALTPAQAMATAKTGAALPTPPAVAPVPAPSAPSVVTLPAVASVAAPSANVAPAAKAAPVPQPATGDKVEAMSNMRKKISEHMTLSRRTSAHVSTVYEIDMTNVVKLRERNKKAFQEAHGTKLSYMPFIFQAVTQALRKYPILNAQVSGDNIIYKRDINLGMAVALDWGLIVPVIKRADDLSLAGLAKTANDLAERARAKQLKPDEVAGGTFTITNPGVFGGLFGTPIINQPQVGILGVGAIVKRPMVKTSPEGDDYIAIRSMAYFALTFDHRIVDGADAERFLSHVKQTLEAGQFMV